MAKTTGLGNALWLDGVDLSGDIQALGSLGGGPAAWDTTSINQSAHERSGTQRSAILQATTFHNPSAGAAHPTLDTFTRSDRIASYVFSVATSGEAFNVVSKEVAYNPSRTDTGALTHSLEVQSTGYGGEFGVLHTNGKRTDTAATNGTGLDGSASSSFGLQAYLHVFAFTGTSVTVKLQHSNDDASTDPYADVTGGAFTAATAVGAQRIATSSGLTIKRWTRVVTTGTFSSAQFAVILVRNQTSTTF